MVILTHITGMCQHLLHFKSSVHFFWLSVGFPRYFMQCSFCWWCPGPCTVMKLLMNPQESMYTSPQLLLTSLFSSLECLFSGMSFLHQQNLPQCVQLHQRYEKQKPENWKWIHTVLKGLSEGYYILLGYTICVNEFLSDLEVHTNFQ